MKNTHNNKTNFPVNATKGAQVLALVFVDGAAVLAIKVAANVCFSLVLLRFVVSPAEKSDWQVSLYHKNRQYPNSRHLSVILAFAPANAGADSRECWIPAPAGRE